MCENSNSILKNMLSFKGEKTLDEEKGVPRMAQINYIKDLYEKEGLSLREIARRTGKDFRTVRKYAHQENRNPPIKKLQAEEFPVRRSSFKTSGFCGQNRLRENLL